VDEPLAHLDVSSADALDRTAQAARRAAAAVRMPNEAGPRPRSINATAAGRYVPAARPSADRSTP